MTALNLTSEAFPSFGKSVRARWAPLLLEPIRGSYERLVIGVAVVGQQGFHLEFANALERLRCLYSDDAEGILWAVELAGNHVRRELASRGQDAISHPTSAVSGISLGECREAEGASLEDIGQNWMRALSSLYITDLAGEEEAEYPLDAAGAYGTMTGDRLPDLVWNYVSQRRSGLGAFFNADIRDGRRRRFKGKSHDVIIDFAGSRLVANFGTLRAGSITKSVDLIKRRLWDLKVDRDGEKGGVACRDHEMIVQAPAADDPQMTERHASNIAEALEALEHQADQEELRLRPLASIEDIGQHVLTAEAA